MSDDAAEVRRLLAPLRDRPVSVDPERLAVRRARVVAALQRDARSLSSERTRRIRRRAVFGALAAAAALSLAAGAFRLSRPNRVANAPSITFVGSVGETVLHQAGAERALHPGDILRADPGELETARVGSAELVTPAGLSLRLGSATQLSLGALLRRTSSQVALRQGIVTCSVPHLQEGRRFSVETPDARVVVHGTVFSVRVDNTRTSGEKTCVEVTDGVVFVQHGSSETALNAGDSWGCEPRANSPTTTATATATEPVASIAPNDGALKDSHGAARGLPRPASGSTLVEEANLFQAALAAERLGQRARAANLLERLLSKYPSSPLVPEAGRALTRVTSTATDQ